MAAAGITGIKAAIIATTSAAWAFIATPIGASIAALAGIVLATKAWYDFNKEISIANREVSAITKLTGDEMNRTRVNAQALAETFDVEVTEVLESARALVNEFGITYEEALTRIENGLVKGGFANSEFLKSMKEYPTFFAQAGYSVEQFQNLVNSGIDLGIYDDKLPDAIKEFALSITEQTPAVREALMNAFGEDFTTKLLKDVKDGSIDVKEALSLIAKEAERVGMNSQQAQQLTADLFRGAGEDAGGALKIFNAVTKATENMNRELTDAEQSMQDLAEAEKEVAEASERAFRSDGFDSWSSSLSKAWSTAKREFYDFIYVITNGQAALDAKKAEQKDKNTEAELLSNNMRLYRESIDLQRKTQGEKFNMMKAEQSFIEKIRSSDSNWDDKRKAQNEAWIKSIQEYGKRVVQTGNTNSLDEINAQKAANKKRLAELQKQLKEEEKLREQNLKYVDDIYWKYVENYKKGEEEITKILKKARRDRELDPAQRADDPTLGAAGSVEQKLSILKKRAEEQKLADLKLAAEKQDLAITERWDNEIAKYGDHLDRIAELEAEKAAELKAAKEEREATQAEIDEQKRLDSLERAAEINQALEDERWAKIFSDAEYLAEFELEEQRKRDLAKAEQANASAEEIEAINRKYDERRKKSGVQMVDFFVGLKDQEVKWTALSEEQKMALIKQGLNIAADMFNKGSGAWKALKIAETTITTFQAAMNAYNSLSGIPIVGPALGAIAAGVVAAAGAKAVSNIAKTKVDKQPKFFYGGYTGKKSKGSDQFGNIVGDVHEDEFVIPKAMTQNPIYADTLAWLERDRQRIYGSAGDAQPLPMSGSGTGTSASGRYQRAGTDENTIALVATLNSLQGLLQKGIPAIVNFGYQDVEELNKMNDEISKSNKNATLNQ